jgi:UDP-4-amino-4,6-dideoxy-N-acetyl-beta-L-altrosamine N-acetyltransferase
MSTLNAQEITGFGVSLRPIQEADLETVRAWRNHIDVARYMIDRRRISMQQQRQWFARVKADTSQQHYLMVYREQAIGVINIKASDQQPLNNSQCIEVGMYLAPGSRYRGTLIAFAPAMAINQFCFQVLGVPQLKAVVLADNDKALRFNEQLGYEVAASTDGLVTLSLSAEGFQRAQQQLAPLLRR